MLDNPPDKRLKSTGSTALDWPTLTTQWFPDKQAYDACLLVLLHILAY